MNAVPPYLWGQSNGVTTYDANGNDISHPKPVGQLSAYPDGWKFATIPLDVAEQLMTEHPILANVIVIHDVDPNGEYIADLIEAVGHIGGERPEEADPATLQRFVGDPVCHCGHLLSDHCNTSLEPGNESAAGCGLCLCDNSPAQVAEEAEEYEEAQAQRWAESNVLCSFCGHRRGVHRSELMGHSCAQARCQCVTYVPPPDPAPDIHITANGGPPPTWVGGALRDAMRFP